MTRKKEQKLSQVMEDYLETIYVLSKDKGYARTGEIARSLEVSPSSVVEMVGKIAKIGLLEWRRYEGVFLSADGRMRGEVIHIRHEMLRRFFEFIGVEPEVANKEACIIEHELSPVTTSAIGNFVNFLQTPAGSSTGSALRLFQQFQDAGLPWEDNYLNTQPASDEEVLHSASRSRNQHEILSALTRHDLLNTMSTLYGYLDLLKGFSTGEEMNVVISRIESVIGSLNRQVSSSTEHLIGGSAYTWINLGELIDIAAESLAPSGIQVQHDLSSLEVYGDSLLEKVIFNLIENSIRHGGDITRINFGLTLTGETLTWYIQDDGTGVADEEKEEIFRTSETNNKRKGLFLVDQVLSACRMKICECGIYGQGARFEVLVPPGLYKFIKENGTSRETVSQFSGRETMAES